MLSDRLRITQYDLRCRCYNIDWWADLATLMPHLTWLELFVGDVDNDVVETPFALQGLLNFTYLSLSVDIHRETRQAMQPSLSLQLPA